MKLAKEDTCDECSKRQPVVRFDHIGGVCEDGEDTHCYASLCYFCLSKARRLLGTALIELEEKEP